MTQSNIEYKKEAWALSEVKDTIVASHSFFLDAQKDLVDGIAGFNDANKTRQNYITALLSYYTNCQGAFNDYLNLETDHIKTTFGLEHLNTDLVNVYSFLGIENIDLSEKDLYKLGLVLSNWNTTKGYLRLLDIHSKEDWKTRLRNAWDNE